MSVVEFGHFVLTIAILLVAVHGLGYIAERLKQPRIVGEILHFAGRKDCPTALDAPDERSPRIQPRRGVPA